MGSFGSWQDLRKLPVAMREPERAFADISADANSVLNMRMNSIPSHCFRFSTLMIPKEIGKKKKKLNLAAEPAIDPLI